MSSMPDVLDIDGLIEVYESNSKIPTNIISADQSWSISVEWKVTPNNFPITEGDYWHLNLFLETMGSDTDVVLTEQPLSFPAKPGPGSSSFSAKFEIKAEELTAGIFKVHALLTFHKKNAKEGIVANYIEGPILQVYSTNF